MCDINKDLNVANSTEEDSDDYSDDNLKIVIDSPNSKRKLPPEPSKSEKLIIQSIEDELQRRLEEKAAKTKLNATHVKNIIKHVVTNEHVLSLVKKAENPNAFDESIPYEPKLTRSKAKELLSAVPVAPMPWSTPKPTSEVQVLFSEDLQEDSSGDEYIPGEEESEDDRDSSVISDPPSVPPPTPPTPSFSADCGTQTNWTEDGVFKIPPSKSKEEAEEEANIARRTRSKLCLSSTPLEVIEEAFIPPDITTDMYDMDCDNEDWMDFLKKFTRPLDEVAKATEDEEQDPEYNILADEEIDEMDKEELRVDKAVKVSRKELNDLIAELFDCSDICTNGGIETDKTKNSCVDHGENNHCDCEVEHSGYFKSFCVSDEATQTNVQEGNVMVGINKVDTIEEEQDIIIKKSQIPLLEQQMLQHVQILTQNFILTYQHPEFHHCSLQQKEYLLNLKFLCEGKQRSMFYTVNLMKALELVEFWENLLTTNSEAVKEMKRYVEKTMAECMQHKQTGNTYIITFPQLILKTISNSDVFLYPSLLPKIPFKPSKYFPSTNYFTDSEDHLIAMGIEQFESLLKHNKKNVSKSTGEINLKIVSSYIQEYMMPDVSMYKIYKRISVLRQPRCASNPIKYYFQNKKAPPVIHFVCPLHELQVLPPCKRLPNQLPHQWKLFNYPHLNITTPQVPSKSFVNLTSLQVTPSTFPQNLIFQPQVLPLINIEKPLLPNTLGTYPRRRRSFAPYKTRKKPKKQVLLKVNVDPISKFVRCLLRPSLVSKLTTLYSNSSKLETEKKDTTVENNILRLEQGTMLPSMPNLGTPLKNFPQSDVNATIADNDTPSSVKDEARISILPEISTISSSSFQQADTSTEVEFFKSTGDSQTVTSTTLMSDGNLESSTSSKEISQSKDENVDESSSTSTEKIVPEIQNITVKPPPKKVPSGAEKKRAKLKREFLANISITAPEDPEVEKQKNEMFALSYYDKMRETLELDDYHKIMQILNEHEEGDAVDLFRKIEKILSPKYQELADEFLLFLREKEAAAVDKLVPWIKMTNRSKFLRKLEIYFKDQPAQLRKIYKCLTDLSQTIDISTEKIKSTLLPMFKGNTVLTDLFLQNLMNERPPQSLLEGPYETIDITKELARPDDEEIFETITIPDMEDKYGGMSCICKCHEIEDPEFKSRYRHCIPCGTRFINGRIYVQSGRGLRPATVSFVTHSNEDHKTRLTGKPSPVTTCPRRKSPSKQIILSPTKENPDEETEDEIDGKKKSKRKSPKKKPSDKNQKRSKEPSKNAGSKKNSSKNESTKSENPSTAGKAPRRRTYSGKKCKGDAKTDKPMEEIIVNTDPSCDQQKLSGGESMEWEDNPGVSLELKTNSPDQQTAESESEFCEESSQDNYCESDSNSSTSSINNQSQSDSNTGEECSWTREEDKIILETFQKENDKEHAFLVIADQLKNRTVVQISNRFKTLMTLLLETLGNS